MSLSRWRLTGSAARIMLACVLVLILFDVALAQTGPFGMPRQPAPADGITGWILAKQAEFYQQFSRLIRNIEADGSAIWIFLGICFLYGIFHAAGPGHGKAVISSYLVANDETWRRGVVLSAAASLLQAVVAVTVVLILAGVIGATRQTMGKTAYWIEMVSYALIALMGARLTWVKGRGLIAAWRARAHDHHKDHGHGSHQRDHQHHAHGDHRHSHAAAHAADEAHARHHAHHHHGHDHDDHAGHAHGPEPQELAGPGGWQRGLSAIVAVGMRPCSGAIIVLIFSLGRNVLWAGVIGTFVMGIGTAITTGAIATLAVSAKGLAKRLIAGGDGGGMLVMRGVEVAAAIVVLLFGVGLLAGYLSSGDRGIL
jgi:nickel/cobalt exporter